MIRREGNAQIRRHAEDETATSLAEVAATQSSKSRLGAKAAAQVDSQTMPSSEDVHKHQASRRQSRSGASFAAWRGKDADISSSSSVPTERLADDVEDSETTATSSEEESSIVQPDEETTASSSDIVRVDPHAAEVAELDKDCQSLDWMGFLHFSNTNSSRKDNTREAVWMLKHREIMPSDVADALLDLEGKHDDKFRQLVSSWAASVNGSCSNPDLCLEIATRVLSSDESVCPRGRLLTRLCDQLQGSWAKQLFAQDLQSQRPRLSYGDKDLSPSQLAVKGWGQGLLLPTAPFWDGTRFDVSVASNFGSHYRASIMPLENLVDAVSETMDTDVDLLETARTFLHAAQKQADSIVGSSTLVSLLRLLYYQRNEITPEGLVRDAAVVDYYESRIGKLETAIAKQQVGNDRMDEWEALEKEMDFLSEQLERASADHANMLPGDVGALPAFWMGRLERVRRQLEDRWAGRAKPRQTVMIWTCSFGGGHWAATKALTEYLPDFAVIVTDPTKDKEFYEGDSVGDWIRQHVNPRWDKTYIFNELILKRQHYTLENSLETLQAWKNAVVRGDGTRFAAPCNAPKCDYQSKQLMRRALLRAAPDFVITVYHMDLLPTVELCNELGRLPVMHLSTDADTKMWEVWKDRPEYPHFKLGMPFDLPEGKKTIAPLSKSQVFVAGYAVRPAFLEAPMTKERLEVERLKRKVASGAMVALIMCGSEGYDMPWPKQLADSETWNGRPLHIFVVVGSNDELGKTLETSLTAQEQADGHILLKGTNKLVTLEVVKESANTIVNSKAAYFVPENELVVLMDLADVLLTKAGGSTTAEAAYRGLPVLFDDTDGMLKWEAFNAHLVKDHHRGKLLVDPDELEHDLLSVAKLGKSLSLVTHHKTGQIVNTTARIRDEIFAMQQHRDKERRRLLTNEVVLSINGAISNS